MNDLDRIKALRLELEHHNYLYHTLGHPKITDAEYDTLYQELLRLEAGHPDLYDPNSPTQRVGEPISSFAKVKHGRRMLSLDNTFTAQEVVDRLGQEDVVLEPKVDGLSLKLIYDEDGCLQQAVTRGNGMEGDDVTVNARTITTIPLKLPAAMAIEVTGEVYMTYSQFNALNQALEANGDELLANPRNAAAGSLKSKEPAEVALRKLAFVVHGCFTELPDVETQLDLLDRLEELHFQTTRMLPQTHEAAPVTTDIVIGTAQELATAIGLADQRRRVLDLPTDGLVFKLNSLTLQRELGEGTKSPKWAVAYKFPPERATTTLEGVTLQVGRTGRITPVAEVTPVRLSGTMVRRASLCNQDEIDRLDIGIGDTVYIEKSAEIIPKIVGKVQSAPPKPHFVMQATCPCCGTELHRPEGMVDLYCPNDDCDDQVYGRLLHALGKQCLDLDGCGKVMVRLLVDSGVRQLSDVFTVESVVGMKQAAWRKFLAGRELVKTAALWRKIHALGIDEIGAGTSQDIAARFPTFITLFTEPDNDLGELERLLGPVAYGSVLRYFDRHVEEIMRLDDLGFRLRSDALALGPLAGKVFVITGTLLSGSRDQVIRKIEEAGGLVKNGVSAKVNYLVMGSEAGGTKTAAAKKHGVTVISEDELYGLMGQKLTLVEPTVSVDDE